MENLAVTDFYKIQHHPEHNVLVMRFIGDLSDETYREMWHKSLEFAVQNKTRKFLIDQSQIGKVSLMARSYVVVNVFPKIKKELGTRLFGAILASDNMANRSGAQFLLKAFKKFFGLEADFFNNDEECLAWLAAVN